MNSSILSGVMLVLGLVAVVWFARVFLSGAVAISARLGLPQAVIAAVVIAIGTSAPELAINLSATFRGEADVVMGNIVGSNIINLALGVGIAGLIAAYSPLDRSYRILAWVGLTMTLLLLLNGWGKIDPVVGRLIGLVLIVVFASYLAASIRLANQSPAEKVDNAPAASAGVSLSKMVIGSIGMAVAAEVTVANATALALALSIPQSVIGATIVAAGGSLPELVSCIIAARVGFPAVAIGNVVGSQIFNLAGILGLSALIRPVAYSASINTDLAILAGLSAVFLTAFYSETARRVMPYLMVGLYAVYAAHLVNVASA